VELGGGKNIAHGESRGKGKSSPQRERRSAEIVEGTANERRPRRGLKGAGGGGGGGPGPLEVEAAEMAGDVDDFADEEKAAEIAGFHGFAGEFASVDAAGGDFGFLVAFGGGGGNGPGVELLFESGERGIVEGGRRVEFEPTGGKTLREEFLKDVADGGEITMGGGAERGGDVALGSEIELDGLAFFPVRRNLQDGGAAESAMSEKQFFAEGLVRGGGDHVGGDAGESGIAVMIGALENEGDECRSSGNEFMAELAGEIVAEGGGAHFGDGESASGNDENGGAKFL